ncbi:hypothetical protein V502_09774 [Pseudogymnoascus sp. VKM F-4520 (FW-2644)]|nr:hypothetical protein V502_09774 [Pseudogymnoascus sp. VKM F-4520 (FW-2644)]
MANNQEYDAETPENATYESDNDDEYTQPAPAQPQKSLQRQRQQVPNGVPANNQVAPPQTRDQIRENMGYRAPVIRESRIKDRPVKKDEKDSAVKIKIELDLEVEVDLYARVKGDVTIGLISDGFKMVVPDASVDMISKCSTLVDYVQFKKWEMKDCFSEDEQFKVSASYAMGIVLNRLKGEYRTCRGSMQRLSDIAPSFFITSNKLRLGCYKYGHGIAYEGCWVTYDDKIMHGSSKRRLPSGKSFTVLCENRRFRKWFTKVLNGTYEEHDFDTLPLDILISLTSPNSPGSLASESPAGLGPSVGLSIPNHQVAAPAPQGAPRIKLNFAPSLNSQVATPAQQLADAPPALPSIKSPAIPAMEKAVQAKEDRLSISNNDQVVADQEVAPTALRSSLYRSPYQSLVIAKEQKATPVQDDSQSASHAASSLDKRTKTDPAHQRQEIIDVSSGDEKNAKFYPDNSQSSSNATPNQKLTKEIASLKLSESRASAKIEKLMQENTSLKLAEMRAENRANEALAKLRAANRANEVLGGNDDLVGRIEELMRENASLKLSMDNGKGLPYRIKGEHTTQMIKEEDATGQREE